MTSGFFSFKLPALTLVKEPRAFKKIRCKRELLAQGEPSGSEEAVRTESCEGEGGGGGGSEQPPITSTELDFIPLELGAGEYYSVSLAWGEYEGNQASWPHTPLKC